MTSPSNITDVLCCFNPSFDLFASSSGDGRIKIWDTVKGQLQTEFSDFLWNDEGKLFANQEQRGNFSIDYTCMKWASFEKTKKRKRETSLLVLGTGNGDVLALDVAAGQLKWRINDCHPGGVSAISFSTQGSRVYTSGADGMVCEVEGRTGNLLRKFKGSSKAVSSVCVSSDGRILATAAAQIKIFNCASHKKIQKFTGHPVAVRCLTMSEDAKYLFSSAVGERYIAVWRVDESNIQSASCVLAMEHPAVMLDCKYLDNNEADGSGFYVLAISEMGVCYFWYGKDIDELREAKPTKISLDLGESQLKVNKGTLPVIFAARIQSVTEPTSIHVSLAHGFLIKPSFEKIVVLHGKDLNLNRSADGLLLPLGQPNKTQKQLGLQSGATALDRANAEGALLPVPKILDHVGPKQLRSSIDGKDVALDAASAIGCPIEDRLKSLGILSPVDSSTAKSLRSSELLKGLDLETIVPWKKMRAKIMPLPSDDAHKILNVLVDMWQSRSCSGKYALPWIYCILVHHGRHILSQDPENATICSLYKIAKFRGLATQSLLQLSGRLQLVTAQIEKTQLKTQAFPNDDEMVGSEDDDDDDEVEEVLFGEEEDESDNSSEDNDE